MSSAIAARTETLPILVAAAVLGPRPGCPRMSNRRVNIVPQVRNAFPGIVTGISSERSRPGSASTT
jgi:hypothetical protein